MSAADIVAAWAVPVFILLIFLAGMIRKVPLFDEFTAGAAEGLKSCVKVIPALVALMTAVAMLQASGALEVLTDLIQPLAAKIGLPPEVVPMALMRPISGSGSLAVLESVYRQYGPDSTAGLVASVLQSSTETTFYTIAVYYGSVRIRKTRHTLAAAVTGDVFGIVLSALAVRMLLLKV